MRISFTSKDLYNHVDAMRKFEIKDDDVKGPLAYLCRKVETNHSFYYRFNFDEER